MPILELIKDKLKLDLTSVIIEKDASMGSSNPFDISARDFLRFAKLDFKSGNDKGNINALINAKRAIDCQIDTSLAIYGIKFDKINSSSNRIIELSNLNKLGRVEDSFRFLVQRKPNQYTSENNSIFIHFI